MNYLCPVLFRPRKYPIKHLMEQVAQRGSDNHIFIRLPRELRPRGMNDSEG